MKTVRFASPQPKQRLFFEATARYICYGGAKGGGKSWCVQHKAALMALRYGGIRILLLRRTFAELRENHIRQLRQLLNGLARWKASDKTFEFPNGSVIVFGYCDRESDVDQYQGQEYDVLFLDEATNFTEYQYSVLTTNMRGVNDFPKRMYLTCNPGGVGHAWVKRLFIDRQYKQDERPEDYVFIPAKVTDNKILMAKDPEYVRRLDNLPPGKREAWRDGKWDVFIGQFFPEWDGEQHVCEPFVPDENWRWYVTLDYGMDMLAAYLIGVDAEERAWVVGEEYEGRDLGDGHDGLIISAAAERVKALAGDKKISAWLGPPDLWNARQETGKSVADIFAESGIYLTKTSNDRIDGWMAVREWLAMRQEPDGARRPRLRIFRNCRNLIRTLPMLQYDERRTNDCKNEPHEITHAPDALRGFCVYWTMPGKAAQTPAAAWTESMWEDYEAAGPQERALLVAKWGRPRR